MTRYKELAFTSNKATELEVDHMSYTAGPSLGILKKYMDQAADENYIPYAPTLGQYITADEARARWANLKEWYRQRGHFWIGTGAYYLEKAFPAEGTVILEHNPDYPDPADKWTRFGVPMFAEVEVDGPGRVAVAVVGESGCGKSTLMKTILGLHRPTRGKVAFEGQTINDLGTRAMRWYRSQVGYVQQDPYGAMPPFMNVRRILEEPLIINGVKNKEEQERRIRSHPYTHALLAATSDPDACNAATFKEVPPGEPPNLIAPPPGCRFHPRCTQAIGKLCDVQEPPEFEPDAGHFVGCWLFSDDPPDHRDELFPELSRLRRIGRRPVPGPGRGSTIRSPRQTLKNLPGKR